MGEQIPAMWQEAEQHLRAFEQLARRTVEEAWLAGDAFFGSKSSSRIRIADKFGRVRFFQKYGASLFNFAQSKPSNVPTWDV